MNPVKGSSRNYNVIQEGENAEPKFLAKEVQFHQPWLAKPPIIGQQN